MSDLTQEAQQMSKAAAWYQSLGFHTIRVYRPTPVLTADAAHPDRGPSYRECSCADPTCRSIDSKSAAKHPVTAGWQNKSEPPSSWTLLKNPAAQGETWNLALLAGRHKGGLLVLDVDVRNGGLKSFSILVTQLPFVQNTLTYFTSGASEDSRGFHLLLKVPETVQGESLWQALRTSKATLAKAYPGIDFQTDGHYAIAAPSLHITGTSYSLKTPLQPPHTLSDDETSQFIHTLDTATRDQGVQTRPRSTNPTIPSDTPAKEILRTWMNGFNPGSIPDGGRNNFMTQIAGALVSLIADDWDQTINPARLKHIIASSREAPPTPYYSILRQINQDLCKPPLGDQEGEELWNLARNIYLKDMTEGLAAIEAVKRMVSKATAPPEVEPLSIQDWAALQQHAKEATT